jgi:hypothetical protein
MDRYLVTWRSKGVRHTENIRADSEEEAKSKSRSLHLKRADYMVVSVILASKGSPRNLNQGGMPVVPTFKQFTCSFSTMNNGTYEAHQIALHALDEASAKETLHRTYPGIIMRTIRIVEVS